MLEATTNAGSAQVQVQARRRGRNHEHTRFDILVRTSRQFIGRIKKTNRQHVAGSSRVLGQFPGAAPYILVQPREVFASSGCFGPCGLHSSTHAVPTPLLKRLSWLAWKVASPLTYLVAAATVRRISLLQASRIVELDEHDESFAWDSHVVVERCPTSCRA